MRSKTQCRLVAEIYIGINKDSPFRVGKAWTCGDGSLTNGIITVQPGRRSEADLSLVFNLAEFRCLHAATWSAHKDDTLRELHEIAERMQAEYANAQNHPQP